MSKVPATAVELATLKRACFLSGGHLALRHWASVSMRYGLDGVEVMGVQRGMGVQKAKIPQNLKSPPPVPPL